MASQYTGSIQDHRSLRELREAIEARGRVGLAVLRAECDKLVRRSPNTPGASGTRGPALLSARPARDLRRALLRGHRLVREVPGARPLRGYSVAGAVRPDGSAGHRRAAAGRSRQLHRLRGPLELHLSDRARGRSHPAGRLARGRRTVHGVPGGVAGRPPHPLAVEPRVHDAGRVSREGPEEIPDPSRYVSVQARRGPVRERRSAGRPDVPRAEPGRRKHLRRLHRRRPARPFHHLARRRSRCLAVRQPG